MKVGLNPPNEKGERLYAFSIAATRIDPFGRTLVYTTVGVTLARSLEEATGKAVSYPKSHYPISDGYSGQAHSEFLIPDQL